MSDEKAKLDKAVEKWVSKDTDEEADDLLKQLGIYSIFGVAK